MRTAVTAGPPPVKGTPEHIERAYAERRPITEGDRAVVVLVGHVASVDGDRLILHLPDGRSYSVRAADCRRVLPAPVVTRDIATYEETPQ
jgi:hypothetical protein